MSASRHFYLARTILRSILSWFLSSIFVTAFLLAAENNSSFALGNYSIAGFGSMSWLEEFVVIALLMVAAILIASIVTLTKPNFVFLALNAVVASIVIFGIVGAIPLLNAHFPNFSAPALSSGNFAEIWLVDIAPVLAVMDIIFYYLSIPFETHMTVVMRRGN